MDEVSKKFIEDNRWPLAQQFLDRAGHAANTVRGLLFSAAAAGIGFVVYDKHSTALLAHVAPLILLGLGAALTSLLSLAPGLIARRRHDAGDAGKTGRRCVFRARSPSR
jgi:hypothetical protein